MNLSLILAAFWVVMAVVAFSYDLRIWGINIPAGWLALVLAGYNLVRWWARRSAGQRAREAEQAAQRRPTRREPADAERERNPDFIFDEPPREQAPPPP
jgi:hypothetical protein